MEQLWETIEKYETYRNTQKYIETDTNIYTKQGKYLKLQKNMKNRDKYGIVWESIQQYRKRYNNIKLDRNMEVYEKKENIETYCKI